MNKSIESEGELLPVNVVGNYYLDNLPQDPQRVVIYGANISGAHDFARAFRRHIEEMGITDAQIIHERNVSYWKKQFYGESDEKPGVRTLPRGVVVFDVMRQYDPWSGQGMFIDSFGYEGQKTETFFDHIKQLCEKHGVPYAWLSSSESTETLLQRLEGFKKALPNSINQDFNT